MMVMPVSISSSFQFPASDPSQLQGTGALGWVWLAPRIQEKMQL